VRRADPDPCGASRRTELSLRCAADFPLGLVGNTVWRIKRRPVWNMWAAGCRPYCRRWRPRCWRP